MKFRSDPGAIGPLRLPVMLPVMLLAMLLACAMLVATGAARAQPQTEGDPPGRVGRLADLNGPVWWFDLEQGQWAEAQRNRPLTAGDRVSTGRDGRAELRIGSTTVRLAEGTELELLRLDDERVHIQLHRGSIALRLRSREVAVETAFGTDEAWLQPQRGGLYRLDREDDTTFANAWRGEMRVEGEAGFDVDSGRRVQLWREGASRLLRHRWASPVDDAFAASVLRDDREGERSASAAYVSTEMTGWEDLDRNGRWDQHPEYGAVWTPMVVASGWVPYRHGRWEWVRPWGWTWIDDAPWGFAPFHYGRWVTWRDRWCWVPGQYVPRPVFAPALVAWIDGPSAGIGLRVGGPTLSWVPLAPWEVYRPHYRSSPAYHERVNPPEHRRWRPPQRPAVPGVVFGNQGVPHAVTVVPAEMLRPRAPRARVDEPRLLPPLPPGFTRGDRPDRGDRGDRGERGDRGDRGDRGQRPGFDARPPAPVIQAPAAPPAPVMPVAPVAPRTQPPPEPDDRAARMRGRAPGGDRHRDPPPPPPPSAVPHPAPGPAPAPMLRRPEPPPPPPRAAPAPAPAPVVKAPPPAEPKPRDREKDKDERPRPGEGRGMQR